MTKRYRDILAVRDLTLEIRDGEFVVLVGPSGCGKSTALRMIAGLEEITSGDLFINGRRVNEVPSKDRDIAMVFQSYALYPHLSVRENLAFGLKLRHTSGAEIERRVSQTSTMLGIGALLDRKPRELSGGQRQRVALGRAIVREPQVFLMDEPLSNLDAQLRVQTRTELIRLHERLETTTIYVTHDQVEAMTMGQRIAAMRDGMLQQVDTPQQLYDHPVNVFVATFIGSPSMNLFQGEIRTNDLGRSVVQTGGLTIPLPSWMAAQAQPGRAVIAGIRPEHITDPREASGYEVARVQARVNVVESLGSEVFAFLEAGGPEFVARFDPRYAPEAHATVEVAIAVDRIHLFDPESEVSLAPGLLGASVTSL
ncbi:MAG: multiple sugar transport system ATP-binding protein [Chloroflexota bacterium]|nr:multiple sugar transport system ATP-binding protein [Chloroflexota bacterium]